MLEHRLARRRNDVGRQAFAVDAQSELRAKEIYTRTQKRNIMVTVQHKYTSVAGHRDHPPSELFPK